VISDYFAETYRTIRLLRDSVVRVVAFNVVHNLLAGSSREQCIILLLFRHFSNELRTSMRYFGVTDARDASAGYIQPARRFDQLVPPRWKANKNFKSLSPQSCTACLSSGPLSCPLKAYVTWYGRPTPLPLKRRLPLRGLIAQDLPSNRDSAYQLEALCSVRRRQPESFSVCGG
jgi:Bacterial TniB protein